MQIRNHGNWGHGLRPGATSDMNCIACKREDEAMKIGEHPVTKCPCGIPGCGGLRCKGSKTGMLRILSVKIAPKPKGEAA